MQMQKLMDFTILNWNIAGAKYLEEPKNKREKFRKKLNETLKRLIKDNEPDVVTLQEIVEYGNNKKSIIDPIKGYVYHKFPLIDSKSLSIRAKWHKLEDSGGWKKGTYFAQGNGFLFRKDVPHQPVWELPKESIHKPRVKRDNYIERVSLESGLYFGDRDSEPRAALVAHFVYVIQKKPLDIFVINLHLTTLTLEREGVPEIDKKATSIRLSQLDIIFNGIISRYNCWKRGGFRERGERRKSEKWESFDRHEPLWVLTGDFNSTEESKEYETILNLNFMDMVPDKGAGTKSPGVGKEATLVLDYVFAGPKFIALNPRFAAADMHVNRVVDERVSDHFPMVATIPIWR